VLTGVAIKDSKGRKLGDQFRETVETTGVRLTVGGLPRGTYGATRAATNTITIAQASLGEDVRAVASVMAHELTHASQIYQGQGGTRDCVRMEVQAFGFEAIVWSSFWIGGLGPSRTPLERQLNTILAIVLLEGEPGLYKFVVDSPGYQQECALWVPY